MDRGATLASVFFMGKWHGEWPAYMWITIGIITLIAVIAAVVAPRSDRLLDLWERRRRRRSR